MNTKDNIPKRWLSIAVEEDDRESDRDEDENEELYEGNTAEEESQLVS